MLHEVCTTDLNGFSLGFEDAPHLRQVRWPSTAGGLVRERHGSSSSWPHTPAATMKVTRARLGVGTSPPLKLASIESGSASRSPSPSGRKEHFVHSLGTTSISSWRGHGASRPAHTAFRSNPKVDLASVAFSIKPEAWRKRAAEPVEPHRSIVDGQIPASSPVPSAVSGPLAGSAPSASTPSYPANAEKAVDLATPVQDLNKHQTSQKQGRIRLASAEPDDLFCNHPHADLACEFDSPAPKSSLVPGANHVQQFGHDGGPVHRNIRTISINIPYDRAGDGSQTSSHRQEQRFWTDRLARQQTQQIGPASQLTAGGSVFLSAQAKAREEPINPDEVCGPLAEALIEKFGSLDGAFDWLDFNFSGCVTRSAWEVGVRSLHFEGCLKNINPKRLFSVLDGSRAGHISLKVWRTFFRYTGDLPRKNSMKGACRLIQRAAKLAAEARARVSRGRACDDMDLIPDELPDLGAIMELGEVDQDGSLGTKRSCKAAAVVQSADQAAEARQIEEDLGQLNMSGVRALSYILAAKCGSLDKAFRWLDYHHKGSYSRCQWETAVVVLRIDIEKMTGFKTQEVFVKMSGRKGLVTKASWDAFFSELNEEDWNRMATLRDDIKKRASKKTWRSAQARRFCQS